MNVVSLIINFKILKNRNYVKLKRITFNRLFLKHEGADIS